MSKIGGELLRDLEKETVTWTTNFDETLKEPAVLPAVFPNLLINGSEGIAVGMATKIPPHNLSEIINALVELIDNPNMEIEDLMKHVKGPDFPTGGKVLGLEGIRDAYSTGRGKVKMQGKAYTETPDRGRSKIIITELPYQVNKANLVEKVAGLSRDKKVEGIAEIRDESDKDGMRVVIEVKKDAVPEVVLNQLYKQTQFEDTFGIILLALVDGTPRVMSLKQLLKEFLTFRQDVVIKRTEFDLRKAEDRAHILEGLKIALSAIDKIIETIALRAIFKPSKIWALSSAFLRSNSVLFITMSCLKIKNSFKSCLRDITCGAPSTSANKIIPKVSSNCVCL
jgi:DNA gyrase subunit A